MRLNKREVHSGPALLHTEPKYVPQAITEIDQSQLDFNLDSFRAEAEPAKGLKALAKGFSFGKGDRRKCAVGFFPIGKDKAL